MADGAGAFTEIFRHQTARVWWGVNSRGFDEPGKQPGIARFGVPRLRGPERRTASTRNCYESCQDWRGAWLVFFLKASLSFSLSGAGRGSKRFLGADNGRSRCSSCYPCAAPKGRHQLTRTVTAQKRAHPISESGRGRPQFRFGRAPFQIISVGLVHGFKVPGDRSGTGHGPTIVQPKVSGATRPVRQRHRSTAISPRWLSSARLGWLWGCPARATIS